MANLELPRIDYDRRNGKHYRYAYGIASTDGGFPDRITKADLQDGTFTSWSESGTYPGEIGRARVPHHIPFGFRGS